MEASTPFSYIPNEIIQLILLQLPVKSVIRCQCVCKQWCLLIGDSDFKFWYRGQQQRLIFLSTESISLDRDRRWRPISRFLVRSASHDLRVRRHKLPFGQVYPFTRASLGSDLSVLCSCNGFVLLRVATKEIWLWNPSTKCSAKVLELPPYPEKLNLLILAAGLCYDSRTRDYKAVLSLRRIGRDIDYDYPFLISASFNHKEWRPVQFPGFLDSVIKGGGVEFRDTFHWWASDIKDLRYTPPTWDCFSARNRIIYFDPVRDEFRFLPLPPTGLRERFSIFGLGVIDDCICMMACMVSVQEGKEEPKTKTVWIMKEYGRQESWMIAFVLQMHGFGNSLDWWYGFTFYSQNMNAQEVLVVHTMRRGQIVYVYDRKKDELKTDSINFLTRSHHHSRIFLSMCFYVESLACPHRPQWIDLER